MSPNLDFSLGFGGQGRPRDPDDPIRLLVVGDFSGRASRGERGPLVGRKAWPVDLDSIDGVLAKLAPELRLELGPDLVVKITPRELDDLHPDRIYDTVDAFAELRNLRARLADPRTFAEASRLLRQPDGGDGGNGGGGGNEAEGGEGRGASGSGHPGARGGSGAGDEHGPVATERTQGATGGHTTTESARGAGGASAAPDDGLTEFQRLLGGTGSAGAGGTGAGRTGAGGPSADERGASGTGSGAGVSGRGGADKRSGERSATSPSHQVRSWIENLVGPHIVPDRDPTQDIYLVAVDDTIGSLLRAILHHPHFQAVEAAWRSLLQLVQDSAEIESARIAVLDASLEEWTADIVGGGNLGGLLSADRAAGDVAWSWIVLDERLGTSERQLRALARLTEQAALSGTAVAGVASPALLGIASLAENPDPRGWSGPEDALSVAWSDLRASAAAGHLALATPRTLLRLPYGKSTDPIERFAFEQFAPNRNHEHYLWGNPAYALVLAASMAVAGGAAPAFGTIAERASRMGSLTLTGLPVHVVPDDGGPGMQACAEVFLTEGAADELDRRGFTALVSVRNTDRAKVWKLRSVAGG